jgi:hypothetical protein
VRWRTPITLLVLLGLLFGGAYIGWQKVTAPTDTDADDPGTTTPTCPTTSFRPGQVVRTRDVMVNVFNASNRSGLAGDTRDALTAKGFKKGVAENAPAEAEVANVTIWAANPRDPSVLLVAQQFRGTVEIEEGQSLAPGVVVLLGDEFRGLKPQAPARIRVRQPVQTCASAPPQ